MVLGFGWVFRQEVEDDYDPQNYCNQLVASEYQIKFATELFCLLLILASGLSFEHRNSQVNLDFELYFEVSFQEAEKCLSFIKMPSLVALPIFVNAYLIFLVSCLMQAV